MPGTFNIGIFVFFVASSLYPLMDGTLNFLPFQSFDRMVPHLVCFLHGLTTCFQSCSIGFFVGSRSSPLSGEVVTEAHVTSIPLHSFSLL